MSLYREIPATKHYLKEDEALARQAAQHYGHADMPDYQAKVLELLGERREAERVLKEAREESFATYARGEGKRHCGRHGRLDDFYDMGKVRRSLGAGICKVQWGSFKAQ